MSDIKRQRNCFVFFPSPNFVYSVIINQSRGMTVFLGWDRQKEYVERLPLEKKKERKRDGKRDLTEIASFLNFPDRAKTNWVCVSIQSVCNRVRVCVCVCLCSQATACDWQLYSRNALWLSGSAGCWACSSKDTLKTLAAADFKVVTDSNILCCEAEEGRWTPSSSTNSSGRACVWSLQR